MIAACMRLQEVRVEALEGAHVSVERVPPGTNADGVVPEVIVLTARTDNGATLDYIAYG